MAELRVADPGDDPTYYSSISREDDHRLGGSLIEGTPDLEKVSSLLIGSLSVAVSESAKNKPPETRVWGARGLRILHPQVPRGAVVALSNFKTFVVPHVKLLNLNRVL
jgi:hypothetical protein